MAQREFGVRSGRESDVPDILRLMAASLGEGIIPRTEAFWSWKHRNNPFGPSPFWVAEADAGVVGVRVFMRWTWKSEGSRVHAVRAVDTATHPAYQGKGIFRELTLGLVEELARSGIVFVFNTPNEKSRPGYLKMGWVTVGRVSLWLRPHPLGRLSAGFVRRSTDVAWTDPLACAGQAAIDSDALESLGSSTLESLQRSKERYHTPIDAAYLRWRYFQCPAAPYGLASLDPRRALVAFRLRARRALRELTICDVLSERSSAGMRAVRATLRYLLARAAPDYAICAAHATPFEALTLSGAGFVPAPHVGPMLTVRPLSIGAGPDPRKSKSWGASIGDLELF